MKNKVFYIVFFVLLVVFFGYKNIQIKADETAVQMVEGASIRTDDNYALLFTGKANSINSQYEYGFYYAEGSYTKNELLELNNKIEVSNCKVNKEGNFKCVVRLNIDLIEQKITCIAFARGEGFEITSSNVVTRSIMDVANMLGKGSATYVDKIINLAGEYKEAKVLFNPNNGVFLSSNSSENLSLTLKNPCDFPEVTYNGYILTGWKNIEENKIYTSYPGTKKESANITYLAIWEKALDASKMIEEYLGDKLAEKTVVPLEYDGKQVKWIVNENKIISIKDGVISCDYLKRDHNDHDVTIKVEFDGTVATKTYKIEKIEFKDLSNKSPFAFYFSTGSLDNYTNYKDNTINKVFSDKVQEEIDIIYYAFANIDSSGNVYASVSNVINKQLMELRLRGTRIVLCVSGVSGEACRNFNNICGNDTLRKTFVNNLVNKFEEMNFDGLDIDWESASEDNLVDATKMNKLMKELRSEMDKRQPDNKYLLTCAIPSTSWGTQSTRFDFKTINKYADYVNMMSYDLNNSEKSTHVSAFYTSSNDKGYGFGAVYGVNLFVNLGLDKKKIIIGTAAYGKAYKVNGNSSNPKYPGLGVSASLIKIDGISGSFASGTIYYNGVLELKNNPDYVEYTEYNNSNQYVGTYLYNAKEKIFVAFEGEEMIKQKAIFAKNQGVGIMMWSYFEDASGNLVEVVANNIRK